MQAPLREYGQRFSSYKVCTVTGQSRYFGHRGCLKNCILSWSEFAQKFENKPTPEHQICDEADLQRHVDYIHYNPVKHGWVNHPVDWPYSTLHGYIERGILPSNWGGDMSDTKGGYGER